MTFDDAQRLRALADYRVLDTASESAFDNITELAAKIFHTPIALVSLIDERRQWFKSKLGIKIGETPREYAFCDHAIRADETLVVENAEEDPRFAENPLVTGAPSIRFYCGVPLRTPDGHGLGTLCLIDRVPRTISASQRKTLEALAHQVEIELEVRRRLLLVEDALRLQKEQQRMKELLASMLVHDLRAPLTAISLLAGSLQAVDQDAERDIEDLQLEAQRAARMLTDVLDICLHQLGELRLRRATVPLASLVEKTTRSLVRRGKSRGQELLLELAQEPLPADVDPELIGRVLENLLTNAMQHGPSEKPIAVSLRRIAGPRARVEVRDQGEPIPPEHRESLFRAFETRAPVSSERHFGLGLAFCALAVQKHGGRLGVEPGRPSGNCFFFEVSLVP